MSAFKLSTLSLAVLFIQACGAPDPPPPAKTVFDPLTQQLDKARAVQKTVDQNTASTRKAVDAQEQGDSAQ